MAKRTKVPRASIACTILDDPEYVALVLDKQGRNAFGLYIAMLCAAKSQANEGVFDQQPAIIAALIRWPLAAYKSALATLCNRTNWILQSTSGKGFTIRNYAKWNAWGGNREGAGRKSSGNQDAPLDESRVRVPASDSVSKDITTSGASAPKPRKPHWSEPHGSKLARLEGCPKSGPWSYLGKLAREHTQDAVLMALGQASLDDLANWNHAKGWLGRVVPTLRAKEHEDQTW